MSQITGPSNSGGSFFISVEKPLTLSQKARGVFSKYKPEPDTYELSLDTYKDRCKELGISKRTFFARLFMEIKKKHPEVQVPTISTSFFGVLREFFSCRLLFAKEEQRLKSLAAQLLKEPVEVKNPLALEPDTPPDLSKEDILKYYLPGAAEIIGTEKEYLGEVFSSEEGERAKNSIQFALELDYALLGIEFTLTLEKGSVKSSKDLYKVVDSAIRDIQKLSLEKRLEIHTDRLTFLGLTNTAKALAAKQDLLPSLQQDLEALDEAAVYPEMEQELKKIKADDLKALYIALTCESLRVL